MTSTESVPSGLSSRQQTTPNRNRIDFSFGAIIGVSTASCISGIRDVLCTQTVARIGFSVLTKLLGPAQYHLVTIFHLYLLYRQTCLQSTIRSLRSFFSVARAEDTLFELSLHFARSCAYISTIMLLHNSTAIIHLLWYLILSIGLMAVVYLFSCSIIDRPMRDMTELRLRLLLQTGTSLPALNLIVQTGFHIYNILKQWNAKFDRLRDRMLGKKRPRHWRKPYIYRSLHGKSDVRLLQISRKSAFGKYKCSIIHTPLHLAPAYEAISYTWTDLPSNQKLYVDGWILSVTKGVIDVIEARASVLRKTYLWIDSVCINQVDLTEKATQIQLMKEIYSRAKVVIAWLGFASDANACIQFILDYVMLIESKTNEKGFMGVELTPSGRRAFFNFMSHPYWSRAWIIQEIVVSQDVTISYGHNYFGWKLLEQVINSMFSDVFKLMGEVFEEDIVQPKYVTMIGVRQARMISVLRKRLLEREAAISLDEMLTLSTYCKATDARDKVYSVLGLSTSANEQTVMPDYSKTSGQLCLDVARHLCQHHFLSIVSHSGLGYRNRDPSLPSWVPDYTVSRYASSLTVTDESASEQYYCAAGSSKINFVVHSRLPILTVHCLTFDSISQLGPTYITPPKSVDEGQEPFTDSLASLLEIDAWMRSNMTFDHYLHTDESYDEALWRTITGNRDRRDQKRIRPDSKEFGHSYQQFLQYRNFLFASSDAMNTPATQQILSDFYKGAETIGGPLVDVAQGRRIAITHNGAFAWVPHESLVGDVIGAMQGGQACITMRKEAMPGSSIPAEGISGVHAEWRYVGESYVHGFMDGEALEIGTWHDVHFW